MMFDILVFGIFNLFGFWNLINIVYAFNLFLFSGAPAVPA